MSVPIIGYTSTLKFFDVKIRKQIIYQNSNKTFHFSDNVYTLLTCVNIQTNISAKEVTTESDVINNDIPLLLSKYAKKKANTVINFQKKKKSQRLTKKEISSSHLHTIMQPPSTETLELHITR